MRIVYRFLVCAFTHLSLLGPLHRLLMLSVVRHKSLYTGRNRFDFFAGVTLSIGRECIRSVPNWFLKTMSLEKCVGSGVDDKYN